eukprot:TRINITY_DN1133_c0_g1_i1.p1 TRINITY_DN1133_c0_g1~~TRINITY_DN1133_c0_g1_i1.p1  ORF type:complete len:266 (+),score=33.52 TRINITY_DN1133_c0_g1_i1:120-917(+)
MESVSANHVIDSFCSAPVYDENDSECKKGGIKRKQVKRACSNCRKAHAGCDESRPCKRCTGSGKDDTCCDVPRKKRTRTRSRKTIKKDITTTKTTKRNTKKLRISDPDTQDQTPISVTSTEQPQPISLLLDLNVSVGRSFLQSITNDQLITSVAKPNKFSGISPNSKTCSQIENTLEELLSEQTPTTSESCSPSELSPSENFSPEYSYTNFPGLTAPFDFGLDIEEDFTTPFVEPESLYHDEKHNTLTNWEDIDWGNTASHMGLV